ncbi:hypothetical protein ABTX60_34145 [Streptomyces sp. NPDC126510]|uniref:hypothetical protein n=1 Tax=Streptomyces sp. NPDC126510 TaxID=3155317 RepID=UPI003331AA41
MRVPNATSVCRVGVLPEAAAVPAASTVVGRAPHDDNLQKKIALYATRATRVTTVA